MLSLLFSCLFNPFFTRRTSHPPCHCFISSLHLSRSTICSSSHLLCSHPSTSSLFFFSFVLPLLPSLFRRMHISPGTTGNTTWSCQSCCIASDSRFPPGSERSFRRSAALKLGGAHLTSLWMQARISEKWGKMSLKPKKTCFHIQQVFARLRFRKELLSI